MSNTRKTKLYQMAGKELTRMLARNLDYAPSADELPIVAEVLADDLFAWGFTDDDTDRIAHAINMAGRQSSRFPTCHNIKECIPKRIEWEPEPPLIEQSEETKAAEREKKIKTKNRAMKEIKKERARCAR